MKCRMCGARLEDVVTDLPFKIGPTAIVIVKELPVRQCENCQEFLIEDEIMERVDQILARADAGTELEVVRFAA